MPAKRAFCTVVFSRLFLIRLNQYSNEITRSIVLALTEGKINISRRKGSSYSFPRFYIIQDSNDCWFVLAVGCKILHTISSLRVAYNYNRAIIYFRVLRSLTKTARVAVIQLYS